MIKDESVVVKIISENFYGDSPYSDANNGAVIQLVPDAPVNLTNDPVETDAFSIRFTWEDGASDGGILGLSAADGGIDVIDYDVYYD